MSAWNDTELERRLDGLKPALERPPSARLVSETREQMSRRPARRLTPLTAVAAIALALLLIPAGLKAAEMLVPGVKVSHFLGTLDEWLATRDWGFGEPESPGAPPHMTPEETAGVAHFPIRTPSWLPEGYQADGEPMGYYPNVLIKGRGPERWEAGSNPRDLVVDQIFRAEGRWLIQVVQSARSAEGEFRVELKPGDEELTVAGYPAFWQSWQGIERNAENAARVARGEAPIVDSSHNYLTVYVEEHDQVVEIRIHGLDLTQDEAIAIAESLFD